MILKFKRISTTFKGIASVQYLGPVIGTVFLLK